ncbi:PD-(D/E)XK motif protein [Pedobacter panaciterrae]|uniref:PD-(D/E)XK motif protein n=1 Tax=Pedobacter panaciterrae TaxID=363849 RepID=A0ABU8NU47_9SPHI
MINYREIWKSINEESAGYPDRGLIARKIPSSGAFSVFLATDFRRKIRLLYVKLERDVLVKTNDLPRFRGFEISCVISSIGSFKNSEFLKLTQSIPETEGVFELVISDLCDHITRIKDRLHLNPLLIKVLAEWKLFFERSEDKMLTLAEQKGLFGELTFLKNYLLKIYPPDQALIFWTGGNRTNHDFQIDEKAVEIKATSGKMPWKFTVSSEKQLDNTGLKHLYLVLFIINVHDNRTSDNLSAFVNEVFDMIRNDLSALSQFEIKLAKYGYYMSHSEKYTTGFSLIQVNAFEVRNDFPRLINTKIPLGIGDIKYTVMVSACTEFEIKTDIINLI